MTMNRPNASPPEVVSALLDGHFHGDACEAAVTAVLADARAIQLWHTYQVVGDVLRSSELAPCGNDLAFWERLECRLAQEPGRPQIPVDPSAEWIPTESAATGAIATRSGANEALFRWKMLAATACTALFAVVGLGIWVQTGQRADAQMAVEFRTLSPQPQIVTADSNAGTMMRDPRLDELMAAHRQLGGHSALQVPAGFLRNATYGGSGR